MPASSEAAPVALVPSSPGAPPTEDANSLPPVNASSQRKVLQGGLKRKWRGSSERFSKHLGDFINTPDNPSKKTFGIRQKEKEEREKGRVLERELKDKKKAHMKQKRERVRQKEERKKEQMMKSSSVQIIKDTTKIRKWSKKAKQQLLKMSPEMIEKLYGKS